ncbi:MAG: hypothetical protein LBQ10_02880 [Desulfovibrio sp.]|jgi:hypothetical protein|nr:hypothetical protein [Desulfovibrio sp.]
MRKIFASCLSAFFFILFAFSPVAGTAAADEPRPSAQSGAAPGSPGRPISPLSPAERKKAAACIDYYNLASSLLAADPYTLPEICHAAAHEYLRRWRLKPVPRIAAGAVKAAARRLEPPKGLFAEQTSGQLARLIADMGQALEEILKEYRALEKYVGDDAIIDDGVMGEKIVARLDAACRKFFAARRDFLKLADEESARAEDVFLRDHPLRRQIGLAREAFSLFRQCALLLGEEYPDRETLTQISRELGKILAEAGKPPFRGAPDLERGYRAFLGEAGRFAQALSSGLAGNFHASSREDMTEAISASRRAYNSFARTINEQ